MARPFSGVTDQGKAGKHRWQDARALLDKGRWRGAMYLAGYAVECLLKVKLMMMFQCSNLKELEEDLKQRGIIDESTGHFTHPLEPLLRLTHAESRLRANPDILRRFYRVNRWIPAWRYWSHPSSRQEEEEFMEAVAIMLKWVENNV